MPDQLTLQDAMRWGLTLLGAADLYAPKLLVRKLKRLQPPEDPFVYPGIELMAAKMEASERAKFMEAAKGTSAAWSQFKEGNKIIREIRESLCQRLVIGEMTAFGYEAATPKVPSQLPAYLFEHIDFIDWQKSSVKGHGLEYLSVKVFSADQITAIKPGNEFALNKISDKGGRPTSKVRVSEAIWALMEANKNFFGLPTKTQVSEIKKFIQANHPEEFPGSKGLSDKAVGTHIRNFSNRKLPPKS
jgi:hypothetical protein